MFTNREDELKFLTGALDRAFKGVLTPILLTGLRQIGKTVLVTVSLSGFSS
ncbi:MAG: ATP-binding protein [Candidatus Tectomicrobia bacterium]|nr:ATP-binding protein [Candidatus Tectomicrobia bacterium]